MKDKTKKRVKRAIVVFVVLSVIYGMAVGVGLIRLHNVYHDLSDNGRPTALEEIIPAHVFDQNNAALLYGSAIARLKAEPANDESLMKHLTTLIKQVRTEDPNESAQQEIDQWLDSDLMKEVFALVEQGTRRSGCRFDLDYEGGFAVQMSHLQGLRTLSRLMGRQVQRLASKGQVEQAWQLAETMARFAEATSDEPLLVNQLIRIQRIGATLEAIWTLCETSTPSKQQIATFNTLFSSFASKQPLMNALDGERLICDHTIFRSSDPSQVRQLLEIKDTRWRLLFSAYTGLGKPLFLADHAYYLRIMNQVSSSFETPYSSRTQEDLNVTEDTPSHYLASRMFLPPFYRIFYRHNDMLARLRITSTGLGLIEFRQEHGSYPDTLKDWPRETIADPFTHLPLMYRKESNGFLLYSLGPNKEDDYGQVNTKDDQKGDIAWQYSRAQ
ncbi:MAG: hypothetical protein HQ515_15140 [Phycisphaeraceae bacterium]|nr:hypothetical protein [Phycisphaeraceae bacterium]